ncbi:MAG: DUF4325 domain-containing protein [Patescibacteria group bacterium]
MDLEKRIMGLALERSQFTSKEVANKFGVSRQFAHQVIKKLVRQRKLLKFGVTRKAVYAHPVHGHVIIGTVKRRLVNNNLEEHKVMAELEGASQVLAAVSDDVRNIFQYAFSEMLNNAIEHSKSDNIEVSVESDPKNLIFHVDDFGIGVFRNVMQKRKLSSELEAMQDLLKGKTTTMPRSHSGEGIFFTSKAADQFVLESFGFKLTVDNKAEDIFIEEVRSKKRGTKVTFIIAMGSKRHLSDIFKEYQTDPAALTFDKTEIQIRLYTMGTVHVSRSQARRIMSGLEKFNVITLDFDRVPTVGQAFVDEIFRVFQNKHPHIKIIPVNMNKAVKFMVERAF